MEVVGLGQGPEQWAGLGERLVDALVLSRSEAVPGERQNRVRWRSGRPNAVEAELGEWWRRVTVSQELGSWEWRLIPVWMMSYCTPEVWE